MITVVLIPEPIRSLEKMTINEALESVPISIGYNYYMAIDRKKDKCFYYGSSHKKAMSFGVEVREPLRKVTIGRKEQEKYLSNPSLYTF
jgi:hypothetical protein